MVDLVEINIRMLRQEEAANDEESGSSKPDNGGLPP